LVPPNVSTSRSPSKRRAALALGRLCSGPDRAEVLR
jgi:hypothetical protein